MRKTISIIFISGILMFLLAFMPNNMVQAEELANDHEKLLEVVTNQVTMYVSPTEEAEVVGTLIEGDRLRTFAEQDGWVKTFFNGQPVWVYAKDLKLLEEIQANTSPENTETEKTEENPIEDNKKEADEAKTIDQELEQNEDEREVRDDKEEAQDDYFIEGFIPEHAISGHVEMPVGYIEPKEVQVSEDTIQVTKYQLDGYNILIDAGHGGKDPGAVNGGLYEKDLTLATAKVIQQYLEQEGANVLFTRTDDTFKSLQNRVNDSNTNNTDVFISLHYDYFSDPEVNGINTYFNNQQTSVQLAEKVHASLTDQLDMNDRGIRKENYYVLQNNRKPAILLELGFMTNPGDFKKVQTKAYREDVAKAITDGLVDYFEEKK